MRVERRGMKKWEKSKRLKRQRRLGLFHLLSKLDDVFVFGVNPFSLSSQICTNRGTGDPIDFPPLSLVSLSTETEFQTEDFGLAENLLED